MILDLDAIRIDLAEASGVIDNPDAPHNWAALQAMRAAEEMLRELERTEGHRAALDVAVRGLRELEAEYQECAAPAVRISRLLDKIGATR